MTGDTHKHTLLKYVRPAVIALGVFLSVTAVTVSCHKGPHKLIPRDVMADIYYDIYLTDEAVKTKYIFRRMIDTMRIYEPIFNRHGYTTEDYNYSVSYYLERPDKFEKVFQETKTKLERRKATLQHILELEGKRPRYWPLVDSLEFYTADGVPAPMVFKNLRMLFFKPDSLLPGSPMPDSTLMARPTNALLIFSDSAMQADRNFRFYSTLGFMHEINTRLAALQAADSIAEDKAEVPPVHVLSADNAMVIPGGGLSRQAQGRDIDGRAREGRPLDSRLLDVRTSEITPIESAPETPQKRQVKLSRNRGLILRSVPNTPRGPIQFEGDTLATLKKR